MFGVVLVSQLTGMAIAAGLAILRNEPALTGPDVAWSVVLAGSSAGSASPRSTAASPWGAWASSRRSPGVLAALIPVIAGIVLEGLPDRLVLAGIGLALLAVVLVSRVADEGGGRQGLGLALLAGTTIGLFGVVINQISDGHVFAPLAIVRGIRGGPDRRDHPRDAGPPGGPTRNLLPVLLAIGVLDMAGNAGYIAAVQTGALAIASVCLGLYPVTTVVLAAVFLHERVTRSHAVGIVLASVAVALIGIGSA